MRPSCRYVRVEHHLFASKVFDRALGIAVFDRVRGIAVWKLLEFSEVGIWKTKNLNLTNPKTLIFLECSYFFDTFITKNSET
jgi:hypothetical protein